MAGKLSGAQLEALYHFPDIDQTLWTGLAISMLIRDGLVSYGRAWGLFGKPKLRLTRMGKRTKARMLNGRLV